MNVVDSGEEGLSKPSERIIIILTLIHFLLLLLLPLRIQQISISRLSLTTATSSLHSKSG
jgi:hypothetical protein